MYGEFGKVNYEWCKEIVEILEKWDFDMDRDEWDESYQPPSFDEERVKELGEKIHKRGGLFAMQNNFYTMRYCFDIDYRKLVHIQSVWNGVGDWKN